MTMTSYSSSNLISFASKTPAFALLAASANAPVAPIFIKFRLEISFIVCSFFKFLGVNYTSITHKIKLNYENLTKNIYKANFNTSL